jgi:membrane-bound lytic murein transglycosylase D
MRIEFCVTLLLGTFSGFAQNLDDTANLDDLVSSAEQWAHENLDDDLLRALQPADREKIKTALAEFQKQFQGEYVIDLAQLKEPAKAVLPLLEQYEETFPYALWLKTRLDYLDVADQFRLTIRTPKTEPGQPPPPVPNPSPQKEREIWISKLKERSYPQNARHYMNQLKSIFVSQHVPPALVWVAEVESSFDPRARSPAGAAGLFQLMPATARRFGLRAAWPWDERLKPEPSARAAAQYLSFLHGKFKDWRLALAAYNAGEGTVQDLLARCQAHTYDSIASKLPAETQMYVPKIEATLVRREGLKLADLQLPRGANEKPL